MADSRDFDIFISSRSEDYPHAWKIYHFLTAARLRPFFCLASLPSLGVSEYGQVIDDQLEKVDHLIVVGSSRENLVAPWVEHEWRSFHQEKLSGRKSGNLVTVIVDGLAVEELPMTLRQYQAVRMDQLENILRYMGEIPPPSAQTQRVAEFPGKPTAGNSEISPAVPDRHPLHQFPTGPRVPHAKVTSRIIRAFAGTYSRPTAAGLALRTANELRAEADPFVDPDGILIDPSELPPLESVPALTFWSDIWITAALKGPRMVGALLLTADHETFEPAAKEDISRLLEYLRSMS